MRTVPPVVARRRCRREAVGGLAESLNVGDFVVLETTGARSTRVAAARTPFPPSGRTAVAGVVEARPLRNCLTIRTSQCLFPRPTLEFDECESSGLN